MGLGDFVFSRFAQVARASSSWNPLIHCSFGGAALFAPSGVYEQWIGARACAVGGTSTTSTKPKTDTSTTTGVEGTTSSGLTSTSTETAGVETSTSTQHDDAFLGSSICGVARPWLSVVFIGILLVQTWG